MKRETRYLQKKGGMCYYYLRVPKAFREFDDRKYSKVSLRTSSILVVKERRDAIERAEENYWAALLGVYTSPKDNPDPFLDLIIQRYNMEKVQAVSIRALFK